MAIWGSNPGQDIMVALLCSATTFLVTVVFLIPLTRWFQKHAILDIPNNRSSHKVPIPQGGGLVVVPVILLGWAWVFWHGQILTLPTITLLTCAAGLAALSWWDDQADISPYLRLLTQGMAVGLVLVLLPTSFSITNGALPLIPERILIGFAWIWFINLYNFMDGIDGLTGCETIHLGLGLILCAACAPVILGQAFGLGGILIGTAAAFLLWNWSPAKLFLGDVGSIPLGYLIGASLLMLWANGAWASALILPAYYLADASITLCRRMLHGHSLVAAHREHFYQKAVTRGMSHRQVVGSVVVTNLGLLVASLIAERLSTWIGILIAGLLVIGLLWRLHGHRCRSGAHG